MESILGVGKMRLLTVRHITAYRYKQPVAFGEHRMMLRPRDSHDQSLIDGDGHGGNAHGRDTHGGNTHAWAQVYLPGPGWVDFDPSSGIVGNRDLVRVAVVRDPRQAIPLHGTWTGFPSDYLGMRVKVAVTAAAAEAGRADADTAPHAKSRT